MGTHVSVSLSFIIPLCLLSFISSVLFSALEFSLRHRDLLCQRGCVGSSSGHGMRALCLLYISIRIWLSHESERLCGTAQGKHCNPCSIVLTTAVNIVSWGLALKSLHADSMWIQMRRNDKNQHSKNIKRKKIRGRYLSTQRQSFHSNTVCSIGTAIMLMHKATLLEWFVSVMGRS